MPGHLLMGLDVGGGGGRCLLVDTRDGRTTAATRTWQFATAPGTGGLGSDLDLAAMREGLASASREAIARAGARPQDIAGVACTALRLGCVVLDADGEALLAVPNRDARAVAEGLGMAAQHGDRVWQRMGRWPYPIYPAARLAWLRAQRPDDFARADALLSVSDWVTFALCGERVAEPSQAGETLLFDLAERDWATDWVEELDLPVDLLPAPPSERLRGGRRHARGGRSVRAGPGHPGRRRGGRQPVRATGRGCARVGRHRVDRGHHRARPGCRRPTPRRPGRALLVRCARRPRPLAGREQRRPDGRDARLVQPADVPRRARARGTSAR